MSVALFIEIISICAKKKVNKNAASKKISEKKIESIKILIILIRMILFKILRSIRPISKLINNI